MEEVGESLFVNDSQELRLNSHATLEDLCACNTLHSSKVTGRELIVENYVASLQATQFSIMAIHAFSYWTLGNSIAVGGRSTRLHLGNHKIIVS